MVLIFHIYFVHLWLQNKDTTFELRSYTISRLCPWWGFVCAPLAFFVLFRFRIAAKSDAKI